VATDASVDARLKEYLQKRFRIPNPENVKLGPASESGLPGLLGRRVILSNDRGQTIQGTLFMDRKASKVILGQVLDLSQDPWGRSDLGSTRLSDRAERGVADAPVTIVEFADFECPHCAQAHSTLETMVSNKYKGKLRLVYKNFPLQGHPWARSAAIAAECGRLQNPEAFWTFAREFYAQQGSLNTNNIEKQALGVATKLKLDRELFRACLKDPATAARIDEDIADGRALRVSSTPTFFINGIPLAGPDEKALEFVIKEELAARKIPGG
jgi:protein-disulfide isomerase